MLASWQSLSKQNFVFWCIWLRGIPICLTLPLLLLLWDRILFLASLLCFVHEYYWYETWRVWNALLHFWATLDFCFFFFIFLFWGGFFILLFFYKRKIYGHGCVYMEKTQWRMMGWFSVGNYVNGISWYASPSFNLEMGCDIEYCSLPEIAIFTKGVFDDKTEKFCIKN